MINYRSLNHRALCLLGVSLLAGCGTTGGKSAGSGFSGSTGLTLEDHKEQLHQIVRDDIVAARRSADESGADIYSYRPYFFKAFSDYPEGPDAYKIAFVEQDSKVAPLAAEVTIPKLRFSTGVQKDRAAVRVDNNFQRERGLETISYELRNGNWRRVASLFVASELSTMMGGEWVPRVEEPRNEYDRFEDQEGWVRRTLNRMRIGDDSGSRP